MAFGKTIRGMGINSGLEKRAVKMYDVSKKELIGEFESITDAAKFAGVKVGIVTGCIKNKNRCHKNGLNKVIAFR